VRRWAAILLLSAGCGPEDDGTTSGGINASPECEAYCDVKLECDPDLDPMDDTQREDCLLGCTITFYNASSIDQMVCPMLLQKVYGCVNALPTCQDFLDWEEYVGDPYPCEDQEREYCLNCGGCP
jgi:hypothetical protein